MTNMASRIFLVTGASEGIGKQTALRLAGVGATVLMHGRNPSKLDTALKDIQKTSGNSKIFRYVADLATMEGVRKLAADVKNDYQKLDVLINNAGVLMNKRQESADGLEVTFAVNVVAPFLLTSLLLDLIKKGDNPQVIIVASRLQASSIDFNDLQLKTNYDGETAYCLSKTCDIMMTLEMAELFKPIGIRVNTLHPGVVNTQMLLNSYGPVGIPVEEANDEFHLATDEIYKETTGKYFYNLKETPPDRISLIPENRKKLWDILVELTEAKF